jgi:hypothetical protein
MIRKCQAAQFYRTAAWIASSVSLWPVAVETAHRVDLNLAKHFIHRAPRGIQTSLCRLIDIELELEDGEAARTPTREAVCRELTKVARDLADLAKSAEQSAHFLQDLEAWGTCEEDPETTCGICHRLLVRCHGYRFPCGHVFHDHCLTKAVQDILPADEREQLDAVLSSGKRSEAAIQKKEEIVACDCILCGERSIDRIRRSAVPPGSNQWSLDLADHAAAAPSPWRMGLLGKP